MKTSSPEPWLGIRLDKYKDLLDKVTHIIHNAWHVDFNVSFSQLSTTLIRRVRQFVDFSAHSKHSCSIHFISSITTVSSWDVTHGSPQSRVPELSFEDWSLPQNLGYGQSKSVAERLLATASSVSNIPVSIYRVGQIAGPKKHKGKWNEREWFPLILKSSMYLRALPSTLGPLEPVDWIPVDIPGKIIHELISSSTYQCSDMDSTKQSLKSALKIYHVVNPKGTTYSATIIPRLKLHFDLPTVPFEEWVQLLRDSASKMQDVDIEDNPAVKLLGFYEELVAMGKQGRSQMRLDTRNTVQGSQTLRNMDAIDGVCIDNWARQWGLCS